LKVALVFLSGGGMSGGPARSLVMQIPLLVKHPEIERLDVFFPPAFRHMDGIEIPVHTWDFRDWMKGFSGLRARISELDPDVVFIPNGTWFDAGDIPVVCMVRNAEPLVAPFGRNSIAKGLKNLLKKKMARKACRKSARVIAVSEFVRDILVEKWNIDSGKISVVPHGVQSPGPEIRPELPPGIGEGDFWFTAGSLVPYRGLEDIVEAVSMRPGEEKLVIAGASEDSDRYRKKMCRLAKKEKAEDRIVWPGKISAEQMTWCFRKAKAFIMTSRIEACPNILMESMAAGAVSISTKNPPMPEFYGDVPLYYEAGDAGGLAEQIDAVLQMNDEGRQRIAEAACRRAGLYTWKKNVEMIIENLRRVAE